jgi:hypothetical protein
VLKHFAFKKDQTAAHYAANDLDEVTQKSFEQHLMECQDCVDDVERWTAIKGVMPRPRPPHQTADGPVFYLPLPSAADRQSNTGPSLGLAISTTPLQRSRLRLFRIVFSDVAHNAIEKLCGVHVKPAGPKDDVYAGDICPAGLHV